MAQPLLQHVQLERLLLRPDNQVQSFNDMMPLPKVLVQDAGCRRALYGQVVHYSCAHHWDDRCTAQITRATNWSKNCSVHLLVDDRPGTRRKVASSASPPSSMCEMNRWPLSWRRKAPGGAHDGASDRWPARQPVSVGYSFRRRVADKCRARAPCRRDAARCRLVRKVCHAISAKQLRRRAFRVEWHHHGGNLLGVSDDGPRAVCQARIQVRPDEQRLECPEDRPIVLHPRWRCTAISCGCMSV